MAKGQDKFDQAKLWRPAGSRCLTLFEAAFKTFAFDSHVHEEPAIGVIEHGVQAFRYKGAERTALPGSIVTVNPDEVHDGRSGLADGYRYRVVYTADGFFDRVLSEMFPNGRAPVFSRPVTWDPELAGRILAALKAVDQAPSLAEELLSPVLYELFSRHASPAPLAPPASAGPLPARRALEYIREHAADSPNLETLATVAGLSKFHFLREFKKATGASPHVLVLRRKLALAKRALEEGRPPAEAAAAAGFSDQSHLTRRFKASFGITPGAFQRDLLG